MAYFFRVAILKRIGHLVNVFGRLLLIKMAVGLLLQSLVHLSSWRKLQDQVYTRIVIEVAEHPQDMGMSQVALDLDLTAKLVFNVGFLQLGLEQHLESNDELGSLLTGQVNVAELALAERPADFEVAQLPAVLGVTLGKVRVHFLKSRTLSKKCGGTSLSDLTFLSPGFRGWFAAVAEVCGLCWFAITFPVFFRGSRAA